uniref:Protein kinase domain-containing protein n=1 Tax=Rhizophora mucronata TaxID=61149 RepID=A0A2P2J8W9_RHIMU
MAGTIPHEISNLHNLRVLRLGLNNMVGTIPSEIFNFTTMNMIELTRNHFSGHLPSSMGLMLPNLQEVYLSGNNLSGPIPDTICNASQLVQLILSNNSFSGFIPDCLGNLSNLQYLDFEYNVLMSRHSPSGLSFISSLTNCRTLLSLWIGKNPLHGSLPISIGNLSSSLQSFTAHNCNIQGRIPDEIGNLNNLFELNLKGNELVGAIPSTIGQLRQLQALTLAQNKLEGYIPQEICDLERLAFLYLEGNGLVGSIPDCFGNLKSIRSLILASNRFSGSIPSTLWGLQDILQVDLSSNSLNGSLPLEIRNLVVMTAMDISRNQISGAIPNSIGDLQDLVNLSLSGNRLQGIIPASFGKMVSLELLDLSGNNLSGEIPMSMQNLTHLRYFNVCFNQLHGEIPNEGPFANFSIQSFLGNNEFCGAARLQVPPCKGRNSRSSKAPGMIVLRYILPAITSTLFLLVLIVIILRCRRRNAKRQAQEDLPSLATWKRISRRELELATDGFQESNLLGTGSFGSVYKGTLPDGLNIAVKVFNLQHEAAFTSFDTECEVLRNLRHRNLVTIISSCSNLDFKALVLKFMPNLTLEKWLYSDNHCLDIVQRLNIMRDVAAALEYLHYGYIKPVVHCDLKPTNVLLDEHMVAHLSDFGIAKLLGEGDSMTQTMTLATIGYMAPGGISA